VSISVIYHAVSLTVLRNTLVSITVIYHAVSLTVLRMINHCDRHQCVT
jgi:hypothetical protein